jgi:multiple sugar transport system permease protein
MATASRTTIQAAPTGPRARLASIWERHFPTIMSLPAFLVVAGVTVVPVLLGVAYSFTNYNLDRPRSLGFIGLGNYIDMARDPNVPKVLVTTLVFVVGAVTIETLGGLGLALLLARKFRGVGFFRLVYTLPLMTAGIAIAVTWRYLLSPSFGWVNWGLGAVGLPQPDWIAGSASALPSIILADAWSGIPLMAILILAGLLGMSQDLIDAAKTDGASARQAFWYVTLPSIAPVLTIGILFQIVNAFRRFELIQVMTGGGPGIATMVLNYFIYQTGFSASRMGYASALSVLLVSLMLLALFAVFRIARFLR